MPDSSLSYTAQAQRESRETDNRRRRAALHRLAYVLDSAIPLPGGYRIGLDGIIGLIPGLGDLFGTALSSYIVAQAHRLGVPRAVLLRMAGNIALETLVGAVPVLGDLFDFAWKANRRNVALLERHVAQPQRSRRRSNLIVAGLIMLLLALAGGVAFVLVALLRWLWLSASGA